MANKLGASIYGTPTWALMVVLTTFLSVSLALANSPPVADAGNGQIVVSGQPFVIDASASTDSDGDILTYRWSQVQGATAPLFGDVDPRRPSLLSLRGPILTDSDYSILLFMVTVSDGSFSDQDVLAVGVVSQKTSTMVGNLPPVADAGSDIFVISGETFVLSGISSVDPNGDLIYSVWNQISGPHASFNDPTHRTPHVLSVISPNVSVPTQLVFQLTVSDSELSTTDTIVATVFPNMPDVDNDGIYNSVDTNRYSYSNDFDDSLIVGATSGTIVYRGEQIFIIADETNPLGVRITTSQFGGLTAGEISVCGGFSTLSMTPGDSVIVTCGSVEATVISGQVGMLLKAIDGGTLAKTTVSEGNKIIFNPATMSISAPASNIDIIQVIAEGGELVSLIPGSTVTISTTAKSIIKKAVSDMLGTIGHTSREVIKAYSYVQASLDDEFWTDGNHLNPSFGRKVFQLERKAVNQLDKACKPGKKHYIGSDACSFVSASVNAKLAEADRKLAEIAFSEASGGVQKEINKASSELGKANDNYESAGYKNAIKHYKLSWMHSMKAAGIDTRISDDED